MTPAADTSGADTSGAEAPEAPTFTKGQLVSYTWEDPYHADPQTVYGLVLELPTAGDADVPDDEQTTSVVVALLGGGKAAFPPADLAAV